MFSTSNNLYLEQNNNYVYNNLLNGFFIYIYIFFFCVICNCETKLEGMNALEIIDILNNN